MAPPRRRSSGREPVYSRVVQERCRSIVRRSLPLLAPPGGAATARHSLWSWRDEKHTTAHTDRTSVLSRQVSFLREVSYGTAVLVTPNPLVCEHSRVDVDPSQGRGFGRGDVHTNATMKPHSASPRSRRRHLRTRRPGRHQRASPPSPLRLPPATAPQPSPHRTASRRATGLERLPPTRAAPAQRGARTSPSRPRPRRPRALPARQAAARRSSPRAESHRAATARATALAHRGPRARATQGASSFGTARGLDSAASAPGTEHGEGWHVRSRACRD